MRKFTVTTTINSNGTVYKIRRPSKAIQLGDLIEFNFSTDTVKSVVKMWDAQKACHECVLFSKGDKPTRCVTSKDSDGNEGLLCTNRKGSFVFASIENLMEEI